MNVKTMAYLKGAKAMYEGMRTDRNIPWDQLPKSVKQRWVLRFRDGIEAMETYARENS